MLQGLSGRPPQGAVARRSRPRVPAVGRFPPWRRGPRPVHLGISKAWARTRGRRCAPARGANDRRGARPGGRTSGRPRTSSHGARPARPPARGGRRRDGRGIEAARSDGQEAIYGNFLRGNGVDRCLLGRLGRVASARRGRPGMESGRDQLRRHRREPGHLVEIEAHVGERAGSAAGRPAARAGDGAGRPGIRAGLSRGGLVRDVARRPRRRPARRGVRLGPGPPDTRTGSWWRRWPHRSSRSTPGRSPMPRPARPACARRRASGRPRSEGGRDRGYLARRRQDDRVAARGRRVHRPGPRLLRPARRPGRVGSWDALSTRWESLAIPTAWHARGGARPRPPCRPATGGRVAPPRAARCSRPSGSPASSAPARSSASSRSSPDAPHRDPGSARWRGRASPRPLASSSAWVPGTVATMAAAKVGRSPASSWALARPKAAAFGLSQREREVLLQIAAGRTNRESASTCSSARRPSACTSATSCRSSACRGRVEAAGCDPARSDGSPLSRRPARRRQPATGVVRRRSAGLARLTARAVRPYLRRQLNSAYQEWRRDRPVEATTTYRRRAGKVPIPGRSSCEIRRTPRDPSSQEGSSRSPVPSRVRRPRTEDRR